MFRIGFDEPSALEYRRARSLAEALELFTREGDSAYLAGGCDLIEQVKTHWKTPRRLIDLKAVPELAAHGSVDGMLRLGALTRLAQVIDDAELRSQYAALPLAVAEIATPQIRNLGTLGGNLLQESRCPYYRGAWLCYRAGGIVCDAHHGINEDHSIYGGQRCFTVSPSDSAPALLALDARVHIAGAGGREVWPLERLFLLPAEDIRHMHRLHDGRVLVAIDLPLEPRRRSHAIKYSMRKVWDFSSGTIAVSAVQSGGGLGQWRVALGSVAPIPWRLASVEAVLDAEGASDAAIGRAGDAAATEAEPLEYNGYKVPLVRKLIEEAVKAVRA